MGEQEGSESEMSSVNRKRGGSGKTIIIQNLLSARLTGGEDDHLERAAAGEGRCMENLGVRTGTFLRWLDRKPNSVTFHACHVVSELYASRCTESVSRQSDIIGGWPRDDPPSWSPGNPIATVPYVPFGFRDARVALESSC